MVGIPQGLVLRLTLFKLYISDFLERMVCLSLLQQHIQIQNCALCTMQLCIDVK